MNNCTFLGRLVRDIDLTFSKDGKTAIAKFSIAVNRKFKKDEADFLNILAFGKTAENLQKFFAKGDLILLQTRAQAGSYDAKDGTKRYTMDFVVDGFEFIPSGKKKEESTSDNNIGNEDLTPVSDEDLPF